MKVTSLSDDKVLELYEKAIKAHIEFLAAASEDQKYLSKISPLEIEMTSGYEYRLDALARLIVTRGLTIPEEWTKYPEVPNYRMMLRVLEIEKVRRLSLVRDRDYLEYERRSKELGNEFEALTDRILLAALDDANKLEGKMMKAEGIAQRVLEKHGYFNKISILMPYINRYWEAAMIVKDRGYVVEGKPALNEIIDVSDVFNALEEALVTELSKASSEKEKEIISAVFKEAMTDIEEIKSLVSAKNEEALKRVSK